MVNADSVTLTNSRGSTSYHCRASLTTSSVCAMLDPDGEFQVFGLGQQ